MMVDLAQRRNPGGLHGIYRSLRTFVYWWQLETEPREWRNPFRGSGRRAKRAGVPVPGLHAFHRSFTISALRSGCDLITLQRMLGHSSLAVVSRYLRQVDDDLRATTPRWGRWTTCCEGGRPGGGARRLLASFRMPLFLIVFIHLTYFTFRVS